MVTLAELSGLACPYCGRSVAADDPGAAAASTVWGWAGVRFTAGDQVAGLMLLAPTDEPGQAMVTCLWVRPGMTGLGHGRQLVQAAAAALVTQRAHTLLARGGRHHVRCDCPPRDFLRAVGFTRGLDDRLWRLDLNRTVVGERSVRSVFERILSSLRPVSPPEPAGGLGRVHRG